METTTGKRGLKRLLMGLMVAVLGTAAMAGWAQPHGGPGGRGPGPMGGPGMMFMGPPEHIDRAVDRMLRGVDATDEQRTKIKAIAQAAAKDVRAQMEAGKGLRQEGRALFTAPTVDANAVEALRQKQLQQHDAVSRRVTQAFVEAANVLTPTQRATLAERFEKRRHGPKRPHAPATPPSSPPVN